MLTLTITSTSHGLSTGDYIVIRNMNTDYTYLTVTATDANTLTCTVADTGGTSGSTGAYIPAFKASSFTEAGVTIAAPNAGDCQINSMNIVTGTKSTSSFWLVMETPLFRICVLHPLETQLVRRSLGALEEALLGGVAHLDCEGRLLGELLQEAVVEGHSDNI